MRILMMSNTYFPIVGGIEQSIYSFSEEFKSLGHEILIVTPAFEGMPIEEPGVIRIPAFQKVNGTIFSINFPSSELLTRYMKDFSPDIVHSHSPFFMGDFALRLSRQHAIPLVFTYHTMFEQYVHFLPIQNEGMKRFMVKYAAGYANLTDQVIAPSESVRDILLKRGVKTPIEVVPTGVDLERFSKSDRIAFRQQNQIPLDAKVIGHAGRLAPEKNMDFLINCMVEALKKDPKVHALIVGLGPAEKMIKDTFKQAGLESRLHLTGVLHYQHLVDAYFAMDVFAFTSLSETQGMVLIEAMAAGIPVVALDAPGARDVIKDYHNGRLLSQMDQQSYVDALIWALSRTTEDLQTIKQLVRMTVQKYPINVSAKRMLEIYENVRSRKSISVGKKNSSRYLFLWRMKAEWDIYTNFIKAIAKSVFEGNFQKTEPKKICDTTGDFHEGAISCPTGESEPDRYMITEDGKRIAFSHIKGGFSKVVIIAHGFYTNKDTALFKGMAEAFSKEYDVITFDFRGHGKSSDVFTWTALEQKDLRAITAYAKENHYEKIGVIGFSFGAAIALIEASRHQNIDSVIAVSSPSDLGSINYHFWEKDMWKDLILNFGAKGRGKGIRPGNPSLKKIRPIDIVDKISPMPVLFLHGEKDWLVKPSHSQRLFDKALDSKALTIIKDGGHAERIFDVFPDKFMKICLDRFKETLK
ncbi:MAG: alpha/beta fold hydrolase [Candidatus Omnitrophota bacterium]|jgi:glycosyltransferase involved in cell wall biosynthesis/pimeloyl-ACP methyl ester carboxylesterase